MSKHSVSNIYLHIVFVIKYRRKVLTSQILTIIQSIFRQVCLDYFSELIEFEGETDHIHLLVKIVPTVKVSDLVRSLKVRTSDYILNLEIPELRKSLWANHLWSSGYYVSSVGNTSIDVIKNYIRNQNSPRM